MLRKNTIFFLKNGYSKSHSKDIFSRLITTDKHKLCSGCSVGIGLPALPPTTFPNSGQHIMGISYEVKVIYCYAAIYEV